MSWSTSWGLYGNADTSISNFLGTTDARPLVIKTSDKVAVRVSAGGDVSVGLPGGTRAPEYKLDVGGVLNADDVHKDGTPLVGSQWEGVETGIGYKAGNVGIGTVAPAAKLHVVGAGDGFHAGIIRSDASENIWRNQLLLQGDKPLSEARLGFATTAADGSGHHAAVIKTEVPADGGGDLVFQAREANFGALTERLRIRNDGNVGLGTATPGERLHVEGGNVRIRQFPANDTTPSLASVQLVSRGAGGGAMWWSLYTAAVGGGWGVNPNSFEIWEYPATRSRLQIRPGGNTVLVPAGGNVGVGVGDPRRRLQVGGDVAGIGLDPSDASPNAGYVRFGDNTGWKLHFGRSRESPAGAPNTGAAGLLMTMQDNGNVGVGTTSPAAKLHVAGGLWNPTDTEGDFKIGDATYRLKMGVATGGSGAGDVRIRAHGGTNRLMLGSGTTDTLFINGDRVGVGTMTPQARLDVTGGDIRLEGGRTFYCPGRLHVHGEEILFLLNKGGVNVSRAWGGNGNLTVEGDLFVGGTRMDLNGFDGAGNFWMRTGGDERKMWLSFHQEGGLPRSIQSAVPFYPISDARVKADVEQLTGVLDKLGSIRGVSFERTAARAPDGPPSDRARNIGVIAQEVQEVFPELVSSHGEGSLKGVDYSGLTGVLVEAVKELEMRNDELMRRLDALERSR